jgi:hypothetical protein
MAIRQKLKHPVVGSEYDRYAQREHENANSPDVERAW